MLNQTNITAYSSLFNLTMATAATLGIMSIVPSQAKAFSFKGPFDPSNWTLTNTNADGSVDTTNAATGTVVLTGGNNGSFSPGTTDWTIPIDSSRAGNITFNWSYFTLDTPGFDSAGFLLNGVYTTLAVQDGDFSTSPVSINVSVGDTFGFRAETSTNTDGPPIFTIYAVPTIPEPSMTLGLLACLGLGSKIKIHNSSKIKKCRKS